MRLLSNLLFNVSIRICGSHFSKKNLNSLSIISNGHIGHWSCLTHCWQSGRRLPCRYQAFAHAMYRRLGTGVSYGNTAVLTTVLTYKTYVKKLFLQCIWWFVITTGLHISLSVLFYYKEVEINNYEYFRYWIPRTHFKPTSTPIKGSFHRPVLYNKGSIKWTFSSNLLYPIKRTSLWEQNRTTYLREPGTASIWIS